jgi:hypothetical protein
MKTIQKESTVKRVDNETADHLVQHGGFKFVPKSTWKQIRDAEKEVVTKDSGRTAPPKINKYKKVKN